MRHVYTTDSRPPRTAKRARQIWDALTEADGAPPQSLSLVVSDGAFRDWMFIRANGDLDEIGVGIFGRSMLRAEAVERGLDAFYADVCANLTKKGNRAAS